MKTTRERMLLSDVLGYYVNGLLIDNMKIFDADEYTKEVTRIVEMERLTK